MNAFTLVGSLVALGTVLRRRGAGLVRDGTAVLVPGTETIGV